MNLFTCVLVCVFWFGFWRPLCTSSWIIVFLMCGRTFEAKYIFRRRDFCEPEHYMWTYVTFFRTRDYFHVHCKIPIRPDGETKYKRSWVKTLPCWHAEKWQPQVATMGEVKQSPTMLLGCILGGPWVSWQNDIQLPYFTYFLLSEPRLLRRCQRGPTFLVANERNAITQAIEKTRVLPF